jgi:hypothetical protein
MRMNWSALVALACISGFSLPATAQSAFDPILLSRTSLDKAAFAFGGAMTASDDNPFVLEYEDNLVFGTGYQQFFLEWPRHLLFGVEAGLAGRFGKSDSAEVWGGAVARYDGFRLFDTLRVAPAFTFGLSAVTSPTEGRESRNEIRDEGDATLLFYLGPELSFSLASRPEIEVFARIHHRSGAWGTLNNMHGAGNASTLGIRYRF